MGRMPARWRVWGRELSPFRVCGVAGFLAAVAVALSLSAVRELSLVTESALIAAAVAVFLGLALATRAVTGREVLVYYHHEIAVLAAVAALAAALGAPLLGYLDATALGLGAFLAFGRVGCLMAGCCHGKPAARGVVYGAGHVHDGFPAYLADVPVVPVQALEAAAVAALVFASVALVSARPGAAFGAYVTGYAVLRFGLELLRGDPARRFWAGLSEAQWTSLLVAAAMGAAAALGWLPGLPEHLGAAAALAMAALVVARRPVPSLLHPRHVRELAAVLPAPRAGRPRVIETSQGVQLSAGTLAGVSHLTLSRRADPLAPHEAAQLAEVIAWLRGEPEPARLLAGVGDTYHLLLKRQQPTA